MQYQFEIHYYKFTFNFHAYYEFFIRNREGDKIKMIMRAQKNTFSLNTNFYSIYYVNPNNPSSDVKNLVGKLKHNTLKTEYNLYDID